MSKREIALGHLVAAHSALKDAGCEEDFVSLCKTVQAAGLPKSVASFGVNSSIVMKLCISDLGVLDVEFCCDYGNKKWYEKIWKSLSSFWLILLRGKVTYHLSLDAEDYGKFKDMFLCDRLS